MSPLDDFFGVRIVIAERIAFAIKDTHRAVAPIFVSGEYAVFIDVAIIAMAPALNR